MGRTSYMYVPSSPSLVRCITFVRSVRCGVRSVHPGSRRQLRAGCRPGMVGPSLRDHAVRPRGIIAAPSIRSFLPTYPGFQVCSCKAWQVLAISSHATGVCLQNDTLSNVMYPAPVKSSLGPGPNVVVPLPYCSDMARLLMRFLAPM